MMTLMRLWKTVAAGAGVVALAAWCAGCSPEAEPKPGSAPEKAKPPVKAAPTTTPAAAKPTSEPAAAMATPPPEPAKPVWTKPRAVTLDESFKVFTKLNPGPAIRVPKVAVAPAIDGVLDDEYKPATPLELRFLDGRADKPTMTTTVRVVATDKDLFVFFDCASPDMTPLRATVKEHDEAVWQDDSVELFLDPANGRSMETYYQITINSLGTTAEVRAPKAANDKSWDPKLRVGTKVGDKGWTAEVAIPFADICGDDVRRVWAVNFNRFAHLKEGTEDTAWCPTGGGDSHIPARFGFLFLDGATLLTADYAKWTRPRHIFRPPERQMFHFSPSEPELILKARDATANKDECYWFGIVTLSNNSDAVLVVADDAAVEVTSLHGWRPINAKWVNPKTLYIWRDTSDSAGYYCLYDVERKKVIIEETYTDGTEVWDRLEGKPPKAEE